MESGCGRKRSLLGRVEERHKQAQVGGGGGGKPVMVQCQSWVGHGTSSPPLGSGHCPKAAKVREEFGHCSQVEFLGLCCAGPATGLSDPRGSIEFRIFYDSSAEGGASKPLGACFFW